ncbi:ABC transporter substrate-binding protein [Paenibacillus thailandensis]|uniref:ABC transporter substrate-binding protein n=1 Tax=Paenibacillus thailandensis TaxID=393250 RepID=A0ABW5QUA7_9BACL
MTRFRLPVLLLLAVVAISGCSFPGAGEKPSDEKITLTLWYWNRSLDDSIIAEAEQRFPNIKINAQKVGGDFKSKLKTTLAAGSGGPDIVALNDWVAELFPSSSHFWNLYELGASDIEAEYLDWKWNLGVTPDGYMVALPIDTGPTALYYRADLFEQAGLPTDPEEVSKLMGTWESYLETGKQLQDKLDGVYLTDNIVSVYTQVTAQNERIYFEKDGTFIGDDPARSPVKKAWDTAVQAHNMGLLANAAQWTPEWNASMNNGKISSFVGAVWYKEVLMDAAPDTAGKWRVASAPSGAGNNGGSFLAILKNSKHPQEAYDFISWLLNPDNQLRSFKNMNLYPSAVKALESPEMLSEEPFFGGQVTGEIFGEAAMQVKPLYLGVRHQSVHGIVTRELESVALQGKNPDKAWDDAMSRIRKELLR